MINTTSSLNFKGFVDTTLRDGAASPVLYDSIKYFFNIEEKKKIITGLVSLGVNRIELFSPIVCKDEKDDFKAIRKHIRNITLKKITLISHCRCHIDDITQAVEAGFDGVNLYMGISNDAIKDSYGKHKKDVYQTIISTIKETRRRYPDLFIRYSGEDAFRTDMKSIYEVYDQLVDSVDAFGFPDTTGIATPDLVKKKVSQLKKRYPGVALEGHFHNDRGLSLINAISAIDAGIDYIQTSIWGLAERSGITSVTALLLNLSHENPDIITQYSPEISYPLNVLMGSILNWRVPWNEVVSLTNRTHIAGVHQKAVLKNPKVYEANALNNFGVSEEQLLLGPLSGQNYIYYYLKEIGNFDIDKHQARQITMNFKEKIKTEKNVTNPADILINVAKEYGLETFVLPQGLPNIRVENLSN